MVTRCILNTVIIQDITNPSTTEEGMAIMIVPVGTHHPPACTMDLRRLRTILRTITVDHLRRRTRTEEVSRVTFITTITLNIHSSNRTR